MTEQWKPVTGFEGMYEVSSLGRVRSLPRYRNGNWPGSTRFFPGKVLTPARVNRVNNYPRVILYKTSTTKCTMLVHRLVAQEFIPNPENKPEIHHQDEVKTHNWVSNLAWVTKAEHDAITLALMQHPRGSKNGFAKLTEAQVIEMRRLYAQGGWSWRTLGKRYAVDRSNVGYIVRGKHWKHLEMAA